MSEEWVNLDAALPRLRKLMFDAGQAGTPSWVRRAPGMGVNMPRFQIDISAVEKLLTAPKSKRIHHRDP